MVILSRTISSHSFFPKFENDGNGDDVLTLLSEPHDVLLVTKKHSGSLVMVYGLFRAETGQCQLVVNSKNGTNNQFSNVAEHYLRVQFRAVFKSNADEKLREFARFLFHNCYTCCFEFVTGVLGDHGQKPRLPYAVLTAVSQFERASQQTRFASLPEMVDIAVYFGLILNEIYVVTNDQKSVNTIDDRDTVSEHSGIVGAAKVCEVLKKMRWEGTDADFSLFLQQNCHYQVHSVLPHSIGQGELLEGLVIQALRTTFQVVEGLEERSKLLLPFRDALIEELTSFGEYLATVAAEGDIQRALPSFSLPNSSGSISDVKKFFLDPLHVLDGVAESDGQNSLVSLSSSMDANACQEPPSALQSLFGYLAQLPPSTLRFISLKRIMRGKNVSVIVHVHKDSIFFDVARNKPVEASMLYRGMEIYLQRELPPDYNCEGISLVDGVHPTANDSLVSSINSKVFCPTSCKSVSNQPQGVCWKILGISKWKNWMYLRRTFCMRNTLSGLFNSGIDAFMAQVLKQFQNWGLPEKHYVRNQELMLCWGRYLLNHPTAGRQFLVNSGKTFSYLSYLEEFLCMYESGQLQQMNGGLSAKSSKNLVVFVLCFRDSIPSFVKELLAGYRLPTHKPAAKIFSSGCVYYHRSKYESIAKDCQLPHAIVVVPPVEDCTDKRHLNMYNNYCKARFEGATPTNVFELESVNHLEYTKVELERLDANYPQKSKFLMCMVGIPPGGGKSCLADRFHGLLMKEGVNVKLISSDAITMAALAKEKGSANLSVVFNASREEFDKRVVRELQSIDTEVIIYDKNIPNLAGFQKMQSLITLSGQNNIICVPLVPESLTEEIARLCLKRVLDRPAGTHTLTGNSQIEGYASTEDFVWSVFIEPSMQFGPVAAFLPNAIVLKNFFVNDMGVIDVHCALVLDFIKNFDSKQQAQHQLYDLTKGRYLALCFELSSVDRIHIEKRLGLSIRDELHATIVFYAEDPQKRLEAAHFLRQQDLNKKVPIELTRLAVITSQSESKDGLDVLAWASLHIPGFEDQPMHATLIADGFPAYLSRLGELAYDSGVLEVEASRPIKREHGDDSVERVTSDSRDEKSKVKRIRYEISKIDLEHTLFAEGVWSICK